MRNLSQIETQIAKIFPPPRRGQRRAILTLSDVHKTLNAKLPTGYGKTYLALAVYSVLKNLGEVNRLLVILPSDGQLSQFEESTPRKWSGYSIDGPGTVCDVRFFGAQAIAKHAKNECQVFAITVQSLLGSRGMDNIGTLMQKGRWMVVVDEYHHYGIDKPFSNAVNALNYEFLLCMSATPYRPDDDGAFGMPHIEVKYREAVEEKAVKPLLGHSYHYKIDAVSSDNEVISFTTEELIAEAGGDSPDAIKKLLIDRKLRWSPKYISPLITNPIDRMLSQRLKTGNKLQAIVGAMCVSHAELVCDQISSTYPTLNVEWVGTGDDGKSSEKNSAIIAAFTGHDGKEPTVDVLVHVGMAGEGLDTVRVSEVIHLNAASHNNTNNQENGRAARYLPGIIGHINFDACSGFAKRGYVGQSIMDAMDNDPPSSDEDKDITSCFGSEGVDWIDIPPEPFVRIVDVECTSIDSGDETVKKMAKWLLENVAGFSKHDLDDKCSDVWKHAIAGVKMMREQESEVINEKSVVKQLKDSVDQALSVLCGNVIRLMKQNGFRIDRTFISDLKKRINAKKKREIGAVVTDADVYRKHYEWIKRLELQIKDTREVPQWLL